MLLMPFLFSISKLGLSTNTFNFKTKKLCKKTLQSFIGIIYSSAQFVLSTLLVRTQLMTHYHIGYFVLSEISINHFF